MYTHIVDFDDHAPSRFAFRHGNVTLPKRTLHMFGDRSRNRVSTDPGRKRHNQRNRTRRIGLRAHGERPRGSRPPRSLMNARRLMRLPKPEGRQPTTSSRAVVHHSKLGRSTSVVGVKTRIGLLRLNVRFGRRRTLVQKRRPCHASANESCDVRVGSSIENRILGCRQGETLPRTSGPWSCRSRSPQGRRGS